MPATPTPAPAAIWDDFVEHHAGGHLLQTTDWGELKNKFGWTPALASAPGVSGLTGQNGQTADFGVAQLLLRRFPPPLGRLAYAPRGPVTNWENPAAVSAIQNNMLALARARRAFALVIEPELLDTPANAQLLRGLGCQPLDWTIQPRRTIWVDLRGEEEQILARMKSKTRYNINLARRKGVTVRVAAADEVTAFYDIMQATSDRNEFGIHPLAYYREFLRLFDKTSALLLAEYQNQPLAGLIVAQCSGRATYLYGASGNAHRDLMPAYLLQWHAMQWARARACHTYDLWGVPDENEDVLERDFDKRNDGLWGVYRFKRGFGGQVVRHTGAWVKVISPIRWMGFRLAKRARKMM